MKGSTLHAEWKIMYLPVQVLLCIVAKGDIMVPVTSYPVDKSCASQTMYQIRNQYTGKQCRMDITVITAQYLFF